MKQSGSPNLAICPNIPDLTLNVKLENVTIPGHIPPHINARKRHRTGIHSTALLSPVR